MRPRSSPTSARASRAPPPLVGFQLFTQFAGTDLGAPGFPSILTRAARVRFGFQ